MRIPLRRLDSCQQIQRIPIHRMPGIGERHIPGITIEELHADVAFKPRDLLAQRLLRDAEAFGGSGEIKMFGDGHERA